MTSYQKTLQTIKRKFSKALVKYGLIEENDHFLIGLSGGKDSLALGDLHGERMKNSLPRFQTTVVHISVENISYQSDLEHLKSQTEQVGIPFIHRITSFDDSIDRSKSSCFLCSWQPRKALFETAKELGCNKIALGHHLNDITETLMMYLVFQGSFGSIPPKMKIHKF